MKRIFLFILIISNLRSFPQARQTENLIIITMDGMRWQEVFGGMDPALVLDKRYTRDSAYLISAFGAKDREERRGKLFPFLWTTIDSEGQLYGDRLSGSEVDNANPYKFSYPGYNEIFTGYPDTGINSNNKFRNPNTNVLEFINKQPGYQARVSAFTTWGVFPYILNKWRSGIYVNSDVDTLSFDNPSLKLINDMQMLEAKPLNYRIDLLTYFAAREYLKAYKPKVLYLAFAETDNYAHEGEYDQYLKSAHAEDDMIRDLWTTIQSIPEYHNKTTLLITSDHGRGDQIREQWRDHGVKIADAGHIWIAVIGPDIKAKGLVKTNSPLYQKQIAPTLAALLGFHFVPDRGNSEPIQSIISK